MRSLTEKGQDRLISYFKGLPGWNKLLASYLGPLDEIKSVLLDILAKYDIDVATSEQLNVLGRLVDEPRSGREDNSYRIAVRARIRANISQSTIEDIIEIIEAALAREVQITVLDIYPAAAQVTIAPTNVLSDEDVETLNRFVNIGKALAVNVAFIYSPPNSFGLTNVDETLNTGKGFGQDRVFASLI
jgi:hypothetical protein